MLRAATYARVSGAVQAAEGYSLGDQERDTREWCRKRGYLLLEHIVDAGETGKLSDRPGLIRLRELVALRVIEVVVFPVIDRVARTNWRIQRELEEIRALGVRVEFVGQPNLEGPDGELMENMLGALAQREHAAIRERTMKGRAAKAREGFYPSGLGRNGSPYGYRVISVAEATVLPEFAKRSGELLIIEEEAVVVRRIFAAYLEGVSIYRICCTLNEEGCRTRTGHLWHPTTVRRMLENPLYGGEAGFGRSAWRALDARGSTGRQKVQRTPRAEADWISRVPVPAIVAAADIAAAVRRLEDNPAPRGPASTVWLLREAVRCWTCVDARGRNLCGSGYWGGQMQIKRYRYYCCNSRQIVNRPSCGSAYPADRLEADLLPALHAAVAPGRASELMRRRAAERARHTAEAEADLNRTRAALAIVDGKLARLADDALAGLFPFDILAAKATALQGERLQLQERHRRLEALLGVPDLEARIAAAEKIHAAVRRSLEDPTPEDLIAAYGRVFRIYLRKKDDPEVTQVSIE